MKKLTVIEPEAGALQERLEQSGLRTTPQREHVFDVLLEKKDHPTAEEVFIRAKKGMPDISMATVYNCLDALVKCGLVRQVNQDREATRLLPEHAAASPLLLRRMRRGVRYRVQDDDANDPPVPMPRGFQARPLRSNDSRPVPECAARGDDAQLSPAEPASPCNDLLINDSTNDEHGNRYHRGIRQHRIQIRVLHRHRDRPLRRG